jgi:hypothetical protein
MRCDGAGTLFALLELDLEYLLVISSDAALSAGAFGVER